MMAVNISQMMKSNIPKHIFGRDDHILSGLVHVQIIW